METVYCHCWIIMLISEWKWEPQKWMGKERERMKCCRHRPLTEPKYNDLKWDGGVEWHILCLHGSVSLSSMWIHLIFWGHSAAPLILPSGTPSFWSLLSIGGALIAGLADSHSGVPPINSTIPLFGSYCVWWQCWHSACNRKGLIKSAALIWTDSSVRPQTKSPWKLLWP